MSHSDSDDSSRLASPPETPQPSVRSRAAQQPRTPSTVDSRVVPATPGVSLQNRQGRNNNDGYRAGDDVPSTPLTPLSTLDDDDGTHTPGRNGNPPPANGEGAGGARRGPPLPGIHDNDDGLYPAAAAGAAPLQPQRQQIRGTDVNISTAAAAFRDFLRNFKSLQHSQRQQRRENRNRNGGGGDDDDDDDNSVASTDDSSVESEGEDVQPLYLSRLTSILAQGTAASVYPRSLDVDTMHIYYHSPECQRFYRQLVAYPSELVTLMDILVRKELERMVSGSTNPDAPIPLVQVRPYNLKTVSNLRCLDPVDMESLVSIKGMVVRCSPVIPDLKFAHFGCVICGHAEVVSVERGRISEPTRCPQCSTKSSFQIQHNRGVYADKQLVRIQETPDKVPAGQTPASVTTFCFDDLVDAVQPGDKVELTGVLKAQPVRVNPKISKVKSVYKTYVDVIHFRSVSGMESEQDKHDMAAAATSAGRDTRHASAPGRKGRRAWPEARVEQLRALSRDPNIYSMLTQSLAPSIWELDNVKKGVLCMLFGGNHVRVQGGRGGTTTGGRRSSTSRRRHSDSNESDDDSWLDDEEEDEDAVPVDRTAALHKRGDINILLCGDPGTSKSQLLTYVHKLSHRGVYTSGKGSSAVGLTASVVRDPETRDLVLESGALVLSDQGICCIDEFDKMSDTTRSVLHEAMEQQTVSIAKAGIIATLHARTSVLASANPTESRYNPNISVVENIQLPPTLLSRFDLIYLILDAPNVDHDRRLAQHLVGLYYETPNIVEPPLDQSLLRDYIEYARENIQPSITDGAANLLISSYLEMRNPGGGLNASVGSYGTRTISATPRQLESLVRLSEALAKMRYSDSVVERDVREAVRLMQVATQAAATDPRTGRIDMDMITTGRSAADRQMEEQVAVTLKELLMERRGSRMTVREIERQLGEITNTTPSHDTVVDMIRRLEHDGVVQWNAHAQTVYVQTGLLVGR